MFTLLSDMRIVALNVEAILGSVNAKLLLTTSGYFCTVPPKYKDNNKIAKKTRLFTVFYVELMKK